MYCTLAWCVPLTSCAGAVLRAAAASRAGESAREAAARELAEERAREQAAATSKAGESAREAAARELAEERAREQAAATKATSDKPVESTWMYKWPHAPTEFGPYPASHMAGWQQQVWW